MIYRENDVFKLLPKKVTYTQNGESQTNFTHDTPTWEAYEELGHISDLVSEEAIYTPEQLERLEEVKELPEEELSVIEDYVLNGVVLSGSRLFDKKRMGALENAQLELADMLLGGL